MCLVFVAWRVHPRYPLVVAANRDEYHARPTAPAAPWDAEAGPPVHEPPPVPAKPPPAAHALPVPVGEATRLRSEGEGRILAGRDLVAGGTWLGVTAEGRFAALTNYRGAVPPGPDAPSRGRLVADFLGSGLGARDHAREVAREAGRYSGFSLLLADGDELFCVTNRGDERIAHVPAGCHGLGNDRLNVPEPKVTGGLAEFRQLLRPDFDSEDLFAVLADDVPAPEADLGESGLERAHSARFIRGAMYGTRSSTVLLVDANGAVVFEERSFDARAVETGRVAYTRRAEAGADFAAARAPSRSGVRDVAAD